MNTQENSLKYVKLKAVKDLSSALDEHKRPVESGWESKLYGLSEARSWIAQGFGVGLALHHCKDLYVIDIDYDDKYAQRFVKACIRSNAVVLKTPRGYHVFLKKGQNTPKHSGKYQLPDVDGKIVVEIYVGDHTRQLVLPVKGTPRAALKTGLCRLEQDEIVYSSVYLDELDARIRSTVELPITFEPVKAVTKQVENDASQEDNEQALGSWEQMYGDRWYALKQKDVLDLMKQIAPQFGRHNVVFYTSRLFGYKGWQKVRLFNAAKELFTPNDIEYKNDYAELRRVIDEGYSQGQTYQINIGKPKVGSSTKAEQGKDNILDYLISCEAKWCEYKNLRYILVNGLAINRDTFKSYAQLSLGIKVSIDFTKSFFEALPRYLDAIDNYVIIEDEVTHYKDKAYVALNVFEQRAEDKEVKLYSYILCSWIEDNMFRYKLYDILNGDTPGDNIYLLFNQSPRRIVHRDDLDKKLTAYTNLMLDDYKNNPRAFETVRFMANMLSPKGTGSQTALAKSAALLAGILGGTSFVAITGPAGTGKTTLSLLLQTIACGDFSRLAMKDEKDVQAALSSRRVLGIDEHSRLDTKTQNAIKSSISGVPVIQRKYYTESQAQISKAFSSVIWSTTDIEELESDLGRRSLHIKLTPFDKPILPEQVFISALQTNSGLLGIDACFLQAICIHKLDQKFDYMHELLTSQYMNLPNCFKNETKIDIAISYYKLCKLFGVDDTTLEQVWYSVRHGALFKSISPWDKVLECAARSKEFALKLYQGMYTTEIFKEVFDSKEANNGNEESNGKDKSSSSELDSVRRKLSRRLNAVSGALRILGFEMAFYKEFHQGKEKYKVHIWKSTLPTPPAVAEKYQNETDEFASTYYNMFLNNDNFNLEDLVLPQNTEDAQQATTQTQQSPAQQSDSSNVEVVQFKTFTPQILAFEPQVIDYKLDEEEIRRSRGPSLFDVDDSVDQQQNDDSGSVQESKYQVIVDERGYPVDWDDIKPSDNLPPFIRKKSKDEDENDNASLT